MVEDVRTKLAALMNKLFVRSTEAKDVPPGNSLVIKVNEAIINMKMDMEDETRGKLKLERGKTLFDIVLDTAKTWVEESGTSQFTAAQLYHEALDRYPELNLKRNSWGAHVISCAPDHPSYRNYTSKRNYFSYLGKGRYRLNVHVIS